MPQDAFHIRRLSKELSSVLTGGKVNRVSQVSKDELTFIIYTGKHTVKLILSTNASNARICLSETEKEPLAVAPNFCMLLRKHLLGAEIVAVRQYAFERIIELDFLCATDFSQRIRTLHCELMGKYSNLIFCENGRILGALKTTALADTYSRVLLAGASYQYPAPQEKISHLDGAGMRSMLKNRLLNAENYTEEDVAFCLFDGVAGLALPTARELVKRCAKNAGGLTACLSSSCEKPLWEFVGEFCEKEPCFPCVRYEKGVPVDFFAFPVENGGAVDSLCIAQDLVFGGKEKKKAFDDKKRKLESAARSLKKKAAKRLQDVSERLKAAENADEYRIKGELLTANLYQIEKGQKFVSLQNWYDENCGEIKIDLDVMLSPSQNAQRYFKTYNKLKRAIDALQPMQKTEQAALSYAESVLSAIALAETQDDLKEIEVELTELGVLKTTVQKAGKKKDEPLPFREYEYQGVKIYVGRNNIQNDRLLKFAGAEDTWLHTQKYHSSHVIIEKQGTHVRDEIILFAAEVCAYYSDGQQGDKIPVDYCKRKFVKKPPKSPFGFVVYTDYKTALVTPNAHEEYRVK